LRAIVEEAEAAGTYVCAHAYMPSAIKRAIQCGVRSIEHGNWLDEECAQLMVTRGVFLVPTVVTYDALREEGVGAGMSADLVAKVGRAVEEVRWVGVVGVALGVGVWGGWGVGWGGAGWGAVGWGGVGWGGVSMCAFNCLIPG
jgi:hypothetical protein